LFSLFSCNKLKVNKDPIPNGKSSINEKSNAPVIKNGMLHFQNQEDFQQYLSEIGPDLDIISHNLLLNYGFKSNYLDYLEIGETIEKLDNKNSSIEEMISYLDSKKRTIKPGNDTYLPKLSGLYSCIANKELKFSIENKIYYMTDDELVAVDEKNIAILNQFIENGTLNLKLEISKMHHSKNLQKTRSTAAAANNFSVISTCGSGVQKIRTDVTSGFSVASTQTTANINGSSVVTARYLWWNANVSVTNRRRVRTLGVWGNWTTISDEDIIVNTLTNCNIGSGANLISNSSYRVTIPYTYYSNTTSKSFNMLNASYEIPLSVTNHMNFSFNDALNFMIANPLQDVTSGIGGYYKPILKDVIVSGNGNAYFNSTYTDACGSRYIGQFNF
jgi:hypothetical protein